MDDGDGVDLGSLRLHVLEKFRVNAREVGGNRRGTEEPLEATLGQVGGDGVSGQQRDALPFGGGACGQSDAGMVRAVDGNNLFFGNEADGLVLTGCRRALVVGKNHLEFCASKPGETDGC